jgi:hypothetical protein
MPGKPKDAMKATRRGLVNHHTPSWAKGFVRERVEFTDTDDGSLSSLKGHRQDSHHRNFTLSP